MLHSTTTKLFTRQISLIAFFVFFVSNFLFGQDIPIFNGTSNNVCSGTLIESNIDVSVTYTINIPGADSINIHINIISIGSSQHFKIMDSVGSVLFVFSKLIDTTITVNLPKIKVQNTYNELANKFIISWQGYFNATVVGGDVTCPYNGSATVAALSGQSPYTYNWSNGAVDQNLTNLVAGTYSLTITDNSNCEYDTTITITDTDMLRASTQVNTVACNNNGSATVNVTGGTTTYNYAWSDGSPTNLATVNNLTGGNWYTVTVTDAVGCSITRSLVMPKASIGGTINGSTTVNAGTNTTNLTLSGYTGEIIKWQYSTNNFTTSNDTLITTETLIAENLNNTTQYRAIVQNGTCNADTSLVATITVVPEPVGGTLNGATTVCSGTNSAVLTLTGYTGSILKWQSSPDNGFLSDVVDITNTNDTYTAVNITTSTYYRAVVSSGGADVNSSTALITVSEPAVGGTSEPTSLVLCPDNTTEITLSGNTGTIQWQQSDNGTNSWANVTGGSGETSSTYTTPVLSNKIFYRALVTNGVCTSYSTISAITMSALAIGGTVTANSNEVCPGSSAIISLTGNTGTIQWQQSDDGTTWADVTGQTTSEITTESLSTDKYYRAMVTNGACSQNSNNVNITISAEANAGTAAAVDVNVCFGSSAVINLSGYTGSSVKWMQSSNGTTNWNNVTGGTGAFSDSYTTALLYDTTYFIAIVTNGTCNDTSNVVVVNVDNTTAGGTISGGATVCSGANTTLLTLTDQVGNIEKWQYSTDNITYNDTAITIATITAENLTQTTYYRAVVKSGSCGEQFSSVATIIVSPATAGGTISGSATVCSGANTTLLTLTGQVGNIEKWQSSTDNFVSVINDIVNTTNTYTAENLAETTYYRAVVESGSCGNQFSDVATIIVSPATVGGTISGGTTVCSGTNSTLLTLTGQVGNIEKWQYSTDNFKSYSDTTINIATLTAENLTQTTYYRAVVKSGSCGEQFSSVATIIVSPATVGGTISGGTTVCSGINSTLLTLTGQVGNIEKWQSSTDNFVSVINDIVNTTNTYTAVNLTQTTYYRAVVKSGSCGNQFSSVATIIVSSITVGGIISGGTTVCSGTNSTLLTLTGQVGNIEKWQSSTDNFVSVINDIVNTTNTYTAENLAETTYYRAVVKSGACGEQFSSVATIIVSPATAGGTISGSATVCSGTNSTLLTLTGQVGNIEKWQSSTDNFVSVINDIVNTTNTYTAVNLAETTYYRAVVKSGACGEQFSSVATITVAADANTGILNGSKTVCYGSNSTLLTLTGQVGNILKWQSSTTNDFSANITDITNINDNYTAVNLTQTTYYRVVVSNGVCSSVNSNIVEITVMPTITVTANITHVTAYGGTNGEIDVTLANNYGITNLNWTGIGTTDINLPDGQFNNIQGNLQAGEYSLFITDALGCKKDTSFIVNQAAKLIPGTILADGKKEIIVCENFANIEYSITNETPATGGNASPTYRYDFQYKTLTSVWVNIVTDIENNYYNYSIDIEEDTWLRRVVHEHDAIAYSDTIFFNFIADEQPVIVNLNDNYCNNANENTIYGLPKNSGGVFTGSGITNNGDGSAQFNPKLIATVTTPTATNVTYTYTDAYGCITSETKSVTINPVPVVSFTLPAKISKDDESFVIHGAIPAGGTFTGNGVTAYDSTINLKNLPSGQLNVTYTYTSSTYGCTNSITTFTDIVAGTGEFLDITSGIGVAMKQYYCYDDDTIKIKAVPSATVYSDNRFLSSFVVSSDNLNGYILPSQLGHGSDTIKYTYKSEGIDFVINYPIYIDSVINEAVIDNLASAYCYSENIVTIKANSLKSGDIGQFSGFGIRNANGANAEFDIDYANSIAPSGQVKYVFTSIKSGCKDSVTQNVTINPLPQISFAIKDTFFIGANPTAFVNVSPDNGVFSGDGINNNDKTFNPQAAGLGLHTIKFEYTNPVTSCYNDSSKTLLVENVRGSITGLPTNKIYCKDANAQTISFNKVTGYNYYNGRFYVNDVAQPIGDNLTINPASFTDPQFTVKYQYTGSDKKTTFWTTETIKIDDIGNLSIGTEKSNYCIYDSEEIIVGYRNAEVANWGRFTGANGIYSYLADNNGKARYNKADAGIGQHKIYYTYDSKTTNSTCSKTDSITINIFPRPDISFSVKPLYNVDGQPDTITAFPSGGIFSPTIYFTTDSVFNPNIAGVGNKTITYQYTDSNYCQNSTTQTTVIISAKGNIGGLNTNNIYCKNGVADTVFYIPADTDPYVPVKFTIDNQILSQNSDTAVIKPSEILDGQHTITYYYLGSDSTTMFSISKTIFIDNIGTLSIVNTKNEFCNYSEPDTLIGYRNGVEAGFGNFTSIAGVEMVNNIINSGKATFNPEQANIGNNIVIYTYYSTYPNSTCFASVNKTLNVNPPPSLTFSLPVLYNINGSVDTMNASPSGGVYSSEQFTISNNLFNPQVAGLGNKTVTYTYTDPITQCTNSVNSTTKVDQATGQLFGLNQDYCYTNEIIPISATAITNSNGAPGVFTGHGIVEDLGNNSAKFSPKTAWDQVATSNNDTIATTIISYTYIGTDNVTSFTLNTPVNVRNNGVITISGLNQQKMYCANHGLVELSATPGPGIFNGNGIENNTYFNPSTDGLEQTTQITYSYTDNIAFCTITKTVDINIIALPEPDFTIPSQVCINSGDIIVKGLPDGGAFSSIHPFTKLNNQNDSILIKPTKDNIGLYTFKYTYTNQNGCTNYIDKTIQIDTVPALTVSGLNQQYCVNAGNVQISLYSNGLPVSSGYFSGLGVSNSANNGKATFSPQSAGVVDNNIIHMYYTQPTTGCSNSDSVYVSVKALPELSFGSHKEGYCTGDSPVFLNGYPNATGRSKFTINGSQSVVTTIEFNPALYNKLSKVPIVYEYTDANTCTNQIFDTIAIYQHPPANFSLNDICIADPIKFRYDSIDTWGTKISDYSWSFYQGMPANEFGHGATPEYQYTSSGEKNVTLNVTSVHGCKSSNDSSFVFQINPKAYFSWKKDCIGEPAVEFLSPLNSQVYNFNWSFGDGSANSTEFAPIHKYSQTGEYPVKLIVKSNSTNSSCADSITHVVTIKPTINFIDNNQYVESFENNNGGWVADTISNVFADTSLWQLVTVSDTIFRKAADGSRAWISYLDKDISIYEQSSITSPCFNLSNLKKPMISLDILSKCDKDQEGAVLQYSTDAGDTWENLGKDLNEGINWHNSLSIKSKPGGVDKLGWTNIDTTWITAKRDLNSISQHNNVRFRLAYAADRRAQGRGFAFDNVYIGNRKHIVLIEHFTNNELPAAIHANDTVNKLVNHYPLDAIDIQYHTAFPAGDEFYNDYPAGASTRSAYYGVLSAPYSIIDGTHNYSFSNNYPDSSIIIKRALTTPEVNIGLETTRTNTSVIINASVKAVKHINHEQLFLYVAIVENQIAIDNGVLVVKNVLRQLMPGNSGEFLGSMMEKSAKSYSYNYTLPVSSTADNITVVAFVQDEQTKQVLQTVTDAIDGSGIVNIDRLFTGNDDNNILIYPNPVSSDATILLANDVNKKTYINVINIQGKIVKHVEIAPNTRWLLLNTQSIANGIYNVQWVNGKNSITNKMVVIH